MNPEVKAQWLQALRSGDYKQTTNKLKRNGGYCCLGVLCDLYAKTFDKTWRDHLHGGASCFLDQEWELPPEVMKWANLLSPKAGFSTAENANLAAVNDAGIDFKGIADLIEIYL